MADAGALGPSWLGPPVIATVARLLCRELTRQNGHLRAENRIPKGKVPGRPRVTDAERGSLTEAALAGRDGLAAKGHWGGQVPLRTQM